MQRFIQIVGRGSRVSVLFLPVVNMLTALDTMLEGKHKADTLKCNSCRVSAGLRPKCDCRCVTQLHSIIL